jgi:hypothetical protein
MFDLLPLQAHRYYFAPRQPPELSDNHPKHLEKVVGRDEHFREKKEDLDRFASPEEVGKTACQPPQTRPSAIAPFPDCVTLEVNRAQEDGRSEKVQLLLHRCPREMRLFLAQRR